MNRHITLKSNFLALLVLLFFNCSCSDDVNPTTDPDPDPITGDVMTIDLNSTHQMIDHFGASDAWSAEWVGRWPESSRAPFAKLLFSSEVNSQGDPLGIGLSMWRFNIAEGAADQPNSGYAQNAWKRETECFLDSNGIYNWSKQAGSQWFLQQARDYGVNKFTFWTNSPPYFMTKNGYTFRTEGVTNYNLAPANYESFATHLATTVKHFEDLGFNIEVLSPFNEPQYPWKYLVGEAKQSGSYATNSEIATITRIIDQKITALGVNSKIMIPESGNLEYLYQGTNQTSNQINSFFNSSSTNYVGDLANISKNVAGHSYWLNPTVEESINHRKSLRSSIQSAGAGLNFWQTEYSLLGDNYLQGASASNLTQIDYALWISRIIHTDLVHGNVTGWSFWTAMNNSTYNDHPYRFGLLRWLPNADNASNSNGTFEITKNLWALGNYSRFVRPGMIRFDVENTVFSGDANATKNFMISGYKSASGNEIVLVCINYKNTDRTLNFGDTISIANDSFTAYTTSSSKNLKKSSMTKDNIVIPKKSIVTLTATLN